MRALKSPARKSTRQQWAADKNSFRRVDRFFSHRDVTAFNFIAAHRPFGHHGNRLLFTGGIIINKTWLAEKHFCRAEPAEVHKIQIKRQKVEYARPLLILILGLTRWKLSECEKNVQVLTAHRYWARRPPSDLVSNSARYFCRPGPVQWPRHWNLISETQKVTIRKITKTPMIKLNFTKLFIIKINHNLLFTYN